MKKLLASTAAALALLSGAAPALAQTTAAPAATEAPAPDALVRQVTSQVLDTARRDKAIQAGDSRRILSLIDTMILPHIDFDRMTASAAGRYWRQATPEQRARLQSEFKTLLIRTYAGALSQVKDQTVDYKPLRARAGDTEVTVRTEVRTKGEPINIDYRMARGSDGHWKIIDVNVVGVWLVDNYRNEFSQQIAAGGIDGLIAKLAERNRSNAASGASAGQQAARG
ncbi:MAG: ABC transporter substrate-binding protein [Burkholderiales bacterium]|nr:ABC transporter substrate-binding protein [Burkholderiales bacterium]